MTYTGDTLQVTSVTESTGNMGVHVGDQIITCRPLGEDVTNVETGAQLNDLLKCMVPVEIEMERLVVNTDEDLSGGARGNHSRCTGEYSARGLDDADDADAACKSHALHYTMQLTVTRPTLYHVPRHTHQCLYNTTLST